MKIKQQSLKYQRILAYLKKFLVKLNQAKQLTAKQKLVKSQKFLKKAQSQVIPLKSQLFQFLVFVFKNLQVVELNEIANPDLIYAGGILQLK